MPTMSTLTDLLRHGLPLLLALSATSLVAKSPAIITLDQQQFAVAHEGKTFQARLVKPPTKNFSGDAALSKATQNATSIFVLGNRSFEKDGHRYFVLAVSTPSTNSNGRGYCGAGSEDHLLLVEWFTTASQVKLTDDVLVQSCLSSIALASDQGNTLESVLSNVKELDPLELSWLTHPLYEGQTRRLTIQAGKWKVLQ